jgi:polyketide synthase PksN
MPSKAPGATEFGTLLLRPTWNAKPLSAGARKPDAQLPTIVFCDWSATQTGEFLKRLHGKAHAVALDFGEGTLADRYVHYAEKTFQIVKDVLSTRPRQSAFLQLVLPNGLERVCLHGLAALLKTAHQEDSRFTGQTLVLSHQISADDCISRLSENLTQADDAFVQYVKAERRVQKWSEIAARAQSSFNPLWKEKAVVLITGGVGGLGLIVAEEIVQRSKAATLILTGRSPLTSRIQQELERLKSPHSEVTYIAADVSRRADVKELLETVRTRYGSLTAIVHSAGIIRDSPIVRKPVEDIGAVLAPKVAGLSNLDEQTQDMNLDIVVLFSSIAGVMGNAGQADYAMANAYMDAYAVYRNQLVAFGLRKGRTLAVNWPLWRSGGMSVDSATENLVEERAGIVPMPTESGVQALRSILEGPDAQTIALYGKREVMKTSFVTEPGL